MTDADVLAVAHRAGNSITGLHEANQIGADVVECDVHAHRGRLEVRHLKTAGPLPFLWDTWELVPASAPRLGLEELLAADRRGAVFMLDLKGRRAETGRDVAAALHEHAAGHRVLVCGRHWPAVDQATAALPYADPVLSARTRAELAALVGRVDGITTNPSLLAKEKGDPEEILVEICKTIDGPISGEVVATDAEGMVREGRHLASLHKNIVVKCPCTTEGLKATKVLTAEGKRVNMTLIFSAPQALLAAKAGARFVSPFVGRLDDISAPGMELVADII